MIRELVLLLTLIQMTNAWLSSIVSSSSAHRPSIRRIRCLEAAVPSDGDVVTVECWLKPKGDFVPEPLFDGIIKSEKLSFVLNAGNYVPGLHELVQSMKVGDSLSNVELDAGWGDWKPELSTTLRFADAGIQNPDDIKVGVQLAFANGMRCRVTETTDETFTVDANPPLAGSSYLADVKLLSVEEGPKNLPYPSSQTSRYEVATFALGCFWGGELAFMRVPGVVGTAVGYTQGQTDNPSYEEVCSGTTGHTEAISVYFDPDVVEYKELVKLAMDRLGDNKYQLNQVGNDRGTQYRHGIYFHTDAQCKIATDILSAFGQSCVTECLPAKVFYKAEEYHQQYLLKGGQSARKNEDSTIRCYG